MFKKFQEHPDHKTKMASACNDQPQYANPDRDEDGYLVPVQARGPEVQTVHSENLTGEYMTLMGDRGSIPQHYEELALYETVEETELAQGSLGVQVTADPPLPVAPVNNSTSPPRWCNVKRFLILLIAVVAAIAVVSSLPIVLWTLLGHAATKTEGKN